ncbi:MAG TPA: DUF1015 domain-containing protein [Myxococcales bacterium]|nr:DUF1015 domain-containing protein [Myxococcales bacterium]
MLEIAPLRALRYTDTAHLSRLIAPPYDVISPEQRERLAALDPHNVVELILPKERAGDGPADNKYVRAGRAFRQWIAEGVLHADPEPGLYALHQRFEWGGRAHVRKGFLARLRLRPFSDGVVLPHERTLSGPKADRLEIFKQTRANLSPIFSLYPDDRGEVDALLQAAVDRPADATATSDDGHGPIEHRLWRVSGAAVDRVREAMAPRRAYIADGHHRYETALNYAKWIDEQGRADPKAPHHFVLSFFCGMADPGLLILPTHRLLHSLAGFEAAKLLGDAARWFTVERLPGDPRTPAGLAQALAKLAESGKAHPSFLAISEKGARADLLSLRADGPLGEVAELPARPELRSLDVTVLHALLLQHVLHLSPQSQERQENLRYVKDAAEGVAAVASGSAQLAFLLNPTLMHQVREVAEAGEVMPQKSTFFYPKLPSGLVFNPLE